MSISQEPVDFNLVFNQLKARPIIINDVMESSQEEKDNLKSLIYTRYNSDLLSNLPSCACGSGFENENTGITGQYNIGVICPNCNTAVKAEFDQVIEPLIWLRAPKGVKGLINPIIWTMLCKEFNVSDFKTMIWLCDSSYRVNSTKKTALEITLQKMLEDTGIRRGYNSFIDNFDYLVDFLFTNAETRSKTKTKKVEQNPLKDLLQTYKNCIFSKYLPLPNKSLLVIEETNLGTFVDPIIVGAIDAILTVAGIESTLFQHSQTVKENRTIRALVELANFNDNYMKSGLAGKPGIFRKHEFGSRVNWGFRAVITSLTDQHDYDELHIPWGIGIAVFRYHIMNKLFKMGYTINAAIHLLNFHAKNYSPLLDSIFKELIDETKPTYDPVTKRELKGIQCTLGRNPSLHRGSLQTLRITKIKTDVHIPTISLSILIVRALGADFDGDECNCMLLLDNTMVGQMKDFAPHKSVLNLDKPKAISGIISMPKPVVSSISSYLDVKDPVDPEKFDRMKSLFIG
jgi:hypothetical protein